MTVALLASIAYGQSYVISTVAGGLPTGEVPGRSLTLSWLGAVVADRSGHVYFTAAGGVMRWDAAKGTVSLITGKDGFRGDKGLALDAEVNATKGLALDAAGSIYVADCGNNLIRKITSGVITTAFDAGSAGLKCPTAVAAGADGSLYLTESEGTRVYKVAGGVLTTVAGTGVAGFSGDDGPATKAQLNRAMSLALDRQGHLYVADSGNGRIRKIVNGVITTVASGMHLPQGLVVKPDGSLCAGSHAGHAVYQVSGNTVTTIAGNGESEADNIPAAQARLGEPSCTVDAAGMLYVTDRIGNRIRRIANGVITTVVGGRTAVGPNTPALGTELKPTTVAVDAAGNVLVMDDLSYSLLRIAEGRMTAVAGNGTSGRAGGDNGPATEAQLYHPRGVAVDGKGDLYIADHIGVRKVSRGVITTVAGGTVSGGIVGGLEVGASRAENIDATKAALSPLGLAVDAKGTLYVGEEGRVRRVAGGVITTVAGGGQSPLDNVPATSARIGSPVALAVDSAGDLYIADMFSHRIRKVSQGKITTVAGNGPPGFNGDNGPATSAKLSYPTGIAVDAAGDLYIADSFNMRVRKVVNGVITTIAGNGQPGFSGDGGPATGSSIVPHSLALDSAGNVYITDSITGYVRKLRPQGPTPALRPAVKPLAALGGRVVGTGQRPLHGARVLVMPVLGVHPELSPYVARPFGFDKPTDKRGEFRVEDLKPGAYRIRVMPPDWASDQLAELETYFPNAASWETAETVTLAAGDDRKDIEIRMRQARLYNVAGRLTFPSGWVSQGGMLFLSDPSGPSQTQGDSFRLFKVAAGEHAVHARYKGVRDGKQRTFGGVAKFSVTGKDIDGVQIALEPSALLRVTAKFNGTPPANSFWVILSPASKLVGDPAPHPRQLLDPRAGTVEFDDVPPGDYYLRLSQAGSSDLALAGLRVNGVELAAGSPFRVNSVRRHSKWRLDRCLLLRTMRVAHGPPAEGRTLTVSPAQRGLPI